ncbi:hypothetical protein PCANC_03320 [Puccinia coronata f. sp. avenae]|uniref:No apical meristem-associated C-terminal domain-containing protein n=1 Tax=Puccinia coronata f. sp. avenae TaxID=200324 RepID=A0A2N5T8S1_9BASI|nr:hypothetical protein PCANC_03320 [Puccinia coronata f. sp. avenae]
MAASKHLATKFELVSNSLGGAHPSLNRMAAFDKNSDAAIQARFSGTKKKQLVNEKNQIVAKEKQIVAKKNQILSKKKQIVEEERQQSETQMNDMKILGQNKNLADPEAHWVILLIKEQIKNKWLACAYLNAATYP